MFCPNCGSQLPDNAKFCGNCGKPISSKETESELSSSSRHSTSAPQSPVEAPKADSSIDPEQLILQKNAYYYIDQFAKCDGNGKSKINWASFFLTIYHAAYRSMSREWLQYQKIPIAISIVGLFLSLIGTVSGSGYVLIPSLVLSSIGGLAINIRSIMFALHFNGFYKKHVEAKLSKHDYTSDISVKKAIMAILAVIVFSTVSGMLSVTAMTSALLNSPSDDFGSTYEDSHEDISGYYDYNTPETYIPTEPDDSYSAYTEPSAESNLPIDSNKPVSIYSYMGTWVVESMNTAANRVTFSLDSMNDHFIFDADGVFRNGNKLTWIEGVSLSFDGTKAIGEYDDDGWGNHGYITLYFDDDAIYMSISAEGNGGWNMAMTNERCIPFEDDAEYTSSEYLFPSDSQYITTADLAGRSQQEVTLIRNEIYARHGYIFKSQDIQNYFAEKSWYYPNQYFDESLLNAVEKSNIDTIIAYEKQMGWRN